MNQIAEEQKPESSANVRSLMPAPLSVSSLQAIGGGDIESIFAGTYQDKMLEATTRTADMTEQVAINTRPGLVTPPSRPAPATK